MKKRIVNEITIITNDINENLSFFLDKVNFKQVTRCFVTMGMRHWSNQHKLAIIPKSYWTKLQWYNIFLHNVTLYTKISYCPHTDDTHLLLQIQRLLRMEPNHSKRKKMSCEPPCKTHLRTGCYEIIHTYQT